MARAVPQVSDAANGPTQQRVIDAALNLFAEKGFAATGIREIADTAGVSTAALYHYMGTKQDLLVHIMIEGLSRFNQAAHAAIEDYPGPAERLVALTRVHVATEAIQRRMSAVIDYEVRAVSDPRQVLKLRDDYDALWTRTLELGMDLRVFDIPDRRLARLGLLEMCNGVGHWYSPNGKLSLSTICDRFSDMTLALTKARSAQTGEALTTAALAMRPATHEISLVRQAFATFCSADTQISPA